MNGSRSMWVFMPLLFLAGGSLMKADTIGGAGSSCATCAGAAYTLTYSGLPISSTATTQTFQITLNVNDIAYTGAGSFLNAVAIKIASPADLVSASLISAPGGFSLIDGTGLVAMAAAAVFCASNRPPMVFPYLVVRTISSTTSR